MPSTLAALALALPAFLGHLHLAGPHSDGAWRVAVSHDRFDDSVSCRVSRSGALYAPGAVILRLPSDVDTSAAEYRVDAGAAHVAVHRVEALGQPGAVGLHTALFNPSGGQVAVPEAEVLGARYVYVRPGPHEPVSRFTVAGLAQALDRARAKGCGG